MIKIKKNKRLIRLIFFFFISMSCFSQVKQPFLTETLHNSDPATIKIAGYLGERIHACVEGRVKSQDVHYLVQPFYNKTETRLWQSEFLGKWLLGAVLSYRYTQASALFDSIQSGVNGLLGSQLPDGYIGNYSGEAQLNHWDIWGRKYSMLGLLTYYDLTGDKKVLDAVKRAADHLMKQVGPGKTNIVATGNYFGMASSSVLEPIVFLYRRTGDARYLDFAKYIVAQWETDAGPCLLSKAGTPVAERFPHPLTMQQPWFGPKNGQKAYEMMSCYEGLLELYQVTNDPLFLSAVEKTARSIIDTEINIAGSGSACECWYHGKSLQTRPALYTMETCVTVTWMKLCQKLLCLTGNPLYADQIEVTAYNALTAAMKNDGSQIATYSPLEGQRGPGPGQCGMNINCCNSNGPRGFALLPQVAVMQAEREIFVNLYTDLEATVILDKKTKVNLIQQTSYPAEGNITISIDLAKPEMFAISLRIPAWSKENNASVNGENLAGFVPGTYYKINRTWKKGDVITLNLDVRARVVKENGYAALMKGPVALARDSRFDDGFVDETAQIVEKDGYVELTPSDNKPSDVWMAFTAPLTLGTGLDNNSRQIHFCDFASAGNTWQTGIRYKVWIPETLIVTRTEYKPYW